MAVHIPGKRETKLKYRWAYPEELSKKYMHDANGCVRIAFHIHGIPWFRHKPSVGKSFKFNEVYKHTEKHGWTLFAYDDRHTVNQAWETDILPLNCLVWTYGHVFAIKDGWCFDWKNPARLVIRHFSYKIV